MASNVVRGLIALIVFMSMPLAAWADCTSPAATAGSIRFFTPDLKFCDGTNWNTLGVTSTGYIRNGNSFGADSGLGLNDAYRLDVKTSGTPRITVLAAGNVGVGTTAPSDKLEVNGNVLASAFLYTSDERLKKNLQPLEDSIGKLTSIRTVSFDWATKKYEIQSGPQIGVIAQDVRKVYPQAVREDQEGWLRVNYPALIAPLIDAVRQMDQRQAAQQAEIAELKKTILRLQQGCEPAAEN